MKIENGLHFTDVGKGKVTLVFLHYFGGSSNSWGKVIAELSHVFRCIAIDLPGFRDLQAQQNRFQLRSMPRRLVNYCKVLHSNIS